MIGDVIAAWLPDLRREAESLLIDTCLIERRTGQTSNDPGTGMSTPTYATYWSGPCRALVRSDTQPVPVGAELANVLHLEVSIAVDAPAPHIGHRITITAAVFDSSLAGAQVFVTGVPVGSQMILRRITAEKAQGADR